MSSLVGMKAKDKVGAQKALVKKKRAVKQIKDWEGALALLEQQKMMLENASTMKDIYNTVMDMNKAIKEAQGNMNIEDLEKVKEDFEEMKDTANEISEFFQSQTEEELGEVDNDLAELEQEIEIKTDYENSLKQLMPDIPSEGNIGQKNLNNNNTGSYHANIK